MFFLYQPVLKLRSYLELRQGRIEHLHPLGKSCLLRRRGEETAAQPDVCIGLGGLSDLLKPLYCNLIFKTYIH